MGMSSRWEMDWGLSGRVVQKHPPPPSSPSPQTELPLPYWLLPLPGSLIKGGSQTKSSSVGLEQGEELEQPEFQLPEQAS